MLYRDHYRGLKLGMSITQAKRTGLLGEHQAANREDCESYVLQVEEKGVGNLGYVHFGKLDDGRIGLARITINSTVVHTPEGIGYGSTPAEVRKAYPDASEFRAGLSDGTYMFLFLERGLNLSGIAIEQYSWCGTF